METMWNRWWLPRLGRALLAAGIGLSFSSTATAGVTRNGEWPPDPAVSLDLDGVPRNEALKRLAAEAGWSLVLNAPLGERVDVHVKKQPAGKVLDLLLSDGEYVASRDGALIAVAPQPKGAAAPAAPELPAAPSLEAPATPPVPPTAAPEADDDDDAPEDKERGRDRVVTGGSLRIEPGETAHDVSVFGGSLEVLGAVTGDISVMGGSVKVRSGARVHGDVDVVGGSLTVEDNARVDGEVDVVGGSLKRGERSIIGGDVNHEGESHAREEKGDAPQSSASDLAGDAGEAVTRTALLFVFGAVLIALATRRMESLKVDIVAHPMKTFALGIVGGLGGIALFVALCVTVIGIPFGVIFLLLAFLGTMAGACAVLETAGAAALGHRTRNPYVHLAAGCLGLLVLGAIPYVGGALYAAVFLIGMGAIVSTRAAGLLQPKPIPGAAPGAHPFRSPG